jgi:hypothetical protein
VVYASSSSALATGSALTFDGTTIGIGPQGTSGQLVVSDAITTVVAVNQDRRYRAALKVGSLFYGGEIFGGLNSSGSQVFSIGVYDGASTSTLSAQFQSNNTKFYVSGSEALTLTSSSLYTASGINVGIGTSSPGSKLDVNGGVVISPNTAGKNTFTFTTNASNDGRLLIKSNTTDKVDIQANGTSYFEGGTVRFISTISVGNSTPSSSGAGITFPATQSASSDANTLDDYEEGTWTPTIAGGYGGVTYATQNGSYTKVGRLVTVVCYLQFSGTSDASSISVGSLPFSLVGATSGNCGTVGYWDVTTDGNISTYIASSTTVVFYKIGTSSTAISTGNVANKYIVFSITGLL